MIPGVKKINLIVLINACWYHENSKTNSSEIEQNKNIKISNLLMIFLQKDNTMWFKIYKITSSLVAITK